MKYKITKSNGKLMYVFSKLRVHAKGLRSYLQSTAPADALVVVLSDGNCGFYCLLSLWLGYLVKRGDPALTTFRGKLADLIIKNEEGFCRKTNIISFSHESFRGCCNQDSNLDYHNNSFCTIRTSDVKKHPEGFIKCHIIKKFGDAVCSDETSNTR